MFNQGSKRIEKVVAKFQKLIDEVNTGIVEIKNGINANNTSVLAAEVKFYKLKDEKKKQNDVLESALNDGEAIANNIGKLLNK